MTIRNPATDPSRERLPLSIVVGTYGHTQALKNGTVQAEGIALEFVEVQPLIAAYRRMVRDLEFDVCELAPTTYLTAREAGVPFIALPILLTRRFHHSEFVCRPGSGIRVPANLEGRNVGVRAYSVSTGVWARGVLRNEFGVDIDRVTWMVDDEEHVTSLQLPPNVTHVADGQSLVSMFRSGQLDAAIKGAAGVGRAGAAAANWETDAVNADEYYDLVPPDTGQVREWFARTGIYPFHGVLAVKSARLERAAWIADSLYTAFCEARDVFLENLRADPHYEPSGSHYSLLAEIVGPNPLPYGIEANRPSIEALIGYCRDQKLIRSNWSARDVFLDVG